MRGGSPEPRRPDFALTMTELRAVTAFAVASASLVLPFFEVERPDDVRPRDALDAAAAFAGGMRRSRAQRVTAVAAHRAAKESASPVAFHAAMAAGDAAGAAYLHPLADAVQVNHILRAAAHTARVFELRPAEAPHRDDALGHVAGLATPVLLEVLCRYPRIGVGTTRVGRLVHELDGRLRNRVVQG